MRLSSIIPGTLIKSSVIKKDPKSKKWILWTKDGKRKLGTHDTAQEAYKQEYAIEKSMQKKASFIVPNYFIKSSAINGTEEDLKASRSPLEGVKEDRRYLTITRPLKSSLTGFTTNSKGKLATPDKRFNLINGERKLVKESANKFTKLLRMGELSNKAKNIAIGKGVLPGAMTKGVTNERLPENLLLGTQRAEQDYINRALKTLENTPASEIYSSKNPLKALQRQGYGDKSKNLQKVIKTDLAVVDYLPPGRSTPVRLDPDQIPLTERLEDSFYQTMAGFKSWKDPKMKLSDKAEAVVGDHTIYAPANSMTGRHELAHVMQIPALRGNTTRYNSNIYLPLKITKSLGGEKMYNRILNDRTYLEELRAQFHATRGKGNKAKAIRQATGAVDRPELAGIRRNAEKLIAKQPHMEDNIRGTLSALEHLNSNYNMRFK